MARDAFGFAARRGSDARLAPRIALVLFVKALGLAALWLLFVRDRHVAVDAHTTAAAFGLVEAKANSSLKREGNVHGQ